MIIAFRITPSGRRSSAPPFQEQPAPAAYPRHDRLFLQTDSGTASAPDPGQPL